MLTTKTSKSIKLLNGMVAQIEADDALVLKLHNAMGAARWPRTAPTRRGIIHRR